MFQPLLLYSGRTKMLMAAVPAEAHPETPTQMNQVTPLQHIQYLTGPAVLKSEGARL